MGLLAFPFVFVIILTQTAHVAVFFIFVMPVWLYFWWGNLIIHLNNADISLNEKNDIITVKTIYSEKKIPLNKLVIKRHNATPRRLGFIFYTNSKNIILNYTKNNYDTIISILKLKQYENIDRFVTDVAKRASIFDLK
jgi:hypothetical protein